MISQELSGERSIVYQAQDGKQSGNSRFCGMLTGLDHLIGGLHLAIVLKWVETLLCGRVKSRM